MQSDFNAIDPHVHPLPDGSLWMSAGSFFSGIKLVQLDPTTGFPLSTGNFDIVLDHFSHRFS